MTQRVKLTLPLTIFLFLKRLYEEVPCIGSSSCSSPPPPLFFCSCTLSYCSLKAVGGDSYICRIQNCFIRIRVFGNIILFNLAYLADDLKDILLVQLLLGPEAPTELVNDVVSVWRVDLRQTKNVSA